MLRKINFVMFGVLILLVPFSSAANSGTHELDSEISRECDTRYEPVISMADPTGRISNPGPPETYEYKVCVKGIVESTISSSCDTTTAFHLSSRDRAAHFSEQNSYYWNVCTGRMKTRLSDGPAIENETVLFSVSDRHNGHVGEPNYYDYNVYGRYRPPENVTLELEFNLSDSDEVYFDNEPVDGEQTFNPPAAFPYLISESGSEERVSGIISKRFIEASRTFSDSKNKFSITRSGSGEFILPFTNGDIQTIETKMQPLLNGRFENSISPNFGFTRVETPVVKVRLSRTDIISNVSISSGFYEFNVTKTGENEVTIEEIG